MIKSSAAAFVAAYGLDGLKTQHTSGYGKYMYSAACPNYISKTSRWWTNLKDTKTYKFLSAVIKMDEEAGKLGKKIAEMVG